MTPWRAWLLASALVLSGCATTLSEGERAQIGRIVEAQRPATLDCQAPDHCAQPSALLAQAASDAPGQHRAMILDEGQDALMARIHLIRAARERIDLQTYIFDEDDAGRLVLRELIEAARRGVKVRVLMDQLTAMKSPRTLAALAGVHANFQARVYNPVFNKGTLSYADFARATVCCFRRLNQRMHTKLLLIDDRIGITGGRNYQDDYYDWDPDYNFRDRDVMLSGPVTADMAANFEAFWASPRSVPVADLRDVAAVLRQGGVPELSTHAYEQPERAREMQLKANDPLLLDERLVSQTRPVEGVSFVADLPQKHRRDKTVSREEVAPSTHVLYGLIESAQEEVMLQTPYLVLSDPAQALFEAMQERPRPPRVVISTNSLAATDAFMVYALSHKYKRRYLRRFGFEIYEYKPHPQDAPIDVVATHAPVEKAGAATPSKPLPPHRSARTMPWENRTRREYQLQRRMLLGSRGNAIELEIAGPRVGLHAKSMVVDEGVGVIGTHNFDPRGDNYNTESAVIIRDPAFAAALAASIRRDIAPANSWVVAPRTRTPIFPGLNYSFLKISEHLPIFDLWPLRYATSYEFVPGPECPEPLRMGDPRFQRCYRPVGDFPEVDIGPKWFGTRVLTAFGAGLAPIL